MTHKSGDSTFDPVLNKAVADSAEGACSVESLLSSEERRLTLSQDGIITLQRRRFCSLLAWAGATFGAVFLAYATASSNTMFLFAVCVAAGTFILFLWRLVMYRTIQRDLAQLKTFVNAAQLQEGNGAKGNGVISAQSKQAALRWLDRTRRATRRRCNLTANGRVSTIRPQLLVAPSQPERRLSI